MTGIGIFSKPELETQTAKTASFTAEAGKLYPVNLGSVTADLVLTFPSSPSVDDMFGVYVSAVHSSGGTSSFAARPYFCIEPADTTDINGSSYSYTSGDGGGIYSLWITGEKMVYRYDGSTWLAYDGRIKHFCKAYLDMAQEVTSGSGPRVDYGAVVKDNASLHSGDGFIWIKRAGDYRATSQVSWQTNSTGDRLNQIDRSSGTQIGREFKSANGTSESSVSGDFVGVPATTVQTTVYQTSGGALDLPVNITNLTVSEVL